MPLPLAGLALAAGGGIVLSVAGGYILEMTAGDRDYSGRDLAIDVGLGVVPGAALLKPSVKIAKSARLLKHFDRGVDTVSGVAAGMVYYNRRNLQQIGIHQATTVLAGGAYDHLTRGGDSSSTRASTRAQKTAKSGSRSQRRVIAPIKNKFEPNNPGLYSCPDGYKLRKHRGRWMCIRG